MLPYNNINYVGYVIVLILVIFLIAVILGILFVPAIREGTHWKKGNSRYRSQRNKKRKTGKIIILLTSILIISILLIFGILVYAVIL